MYNVYHGNLCIVNMHTFNSLKDYTLKVKQEHAVLHMYLRGIHDNKNMVQSTCRNDIAQCIMTHKKTIVPILHSSYVYYTYEMKIDIIFACSTCIVVHKVHLFDILYTNLSVVHIKKQMCTTDFARLTPTLTHEFNLWRGSEIFHLQKKVPGSK